MFRPFIKIVNMKINNNMKAILCNYRKIIYTSTNIILKNISTFLVANCRPLHNRVQIERYMYVQG